MTVQHVPAGSEVELRLPFPTEPRPIIRVRAHLPDGSPLSHGTVWFRGERGPVSHAPVVNGEGRCELSKRLPAGESLPWLMVRDDSRQHAPAVLYDVATTHEPHDVYLKPGLTVAGRVVSNGLTVAVELGAVPGWPYYWARYRTRASDDGRFSIQGLPPGAVTLRRWEREHAQWGKTEKDGTIGPMRVEAGTSGVVVKLEAPAAISGRVITEDAAGAWVQANAVEGYVDMVRVGDDGRFLIQGLLPGMAYELSVGGREFALAAPVTVRAPADNVELQAKQGLSIEGRVESADGQPIPRARVEAENLPDALAERERFQSRIETDEDGQFVLTGLPAGRCVLRLGREHTRTFPVVVEAGARNVLFVATKSRELTGHVEVTDTFLDGFIVEAWPAMPGVASVEPRATEDVGADGFFSLAVPDGTYRLVVWNEQLRDDRYADALVVTGEAEPVLALQKGERISGTARRTNREPAKFVKLLVKTDFGHRKVWTDGRGRFAVPGLPAGQYTLHAPGAKSVTATTGSDIAVTVKE